MFIERVCFLRGVNMHYRTQLYAVNTLEAAYDDGCLICLASVSRANLLVVTPHNIHGTPGRHALR